MGKILNLRKVVKFYSFNWLWLQIMDTVLNQEFLVQ